MGFKDKNSDLFLLHKIKSFDLKNIRFVFIIKKNEKELFQEESFSHNMNLCNHELKQTQT